MYCKIPSVREIFPLSAVHAMEKKCPIESKNEPA